jgi:hypothetical protein
MIMKRAAIGIFRMIASQKTAQKPDILRRWYPDSTAEAARGPGKGGRRSSVATPSSLGVETARLNHLDARSVTTRRAADPVLWPWAEWCAYRAATPSIEVIRRNAS